VKTRLTPALLNDEAARVHAELLLHWIRRLTALAPVAVELCFDPPTARAEFAQLLAGCGVMEMTPQVGGDLGERLAAAVAVVRTRADRVLLVGVDSPDVPDQAILEALASLDRADVTLGPTEDGGYWCVGVGPSVTPEALFRGIEWSSGRERAQTVQRARQLGYTVALAPGWVDVDHADDLARLIDRLAQSAQPADLALLAALKFVPRARLK
jgi:hypothetical protein